MHPSVNCRRALDEPDSALISLRLQDVCYITRTVLLTMGIQLKKATGPLVAQLRDPPELDSRSVLYVRSEVSVHFRQWIAFLLVGLFGGLQQGA